MMSAPSPSKASLASQRMDSVMSRDPNGPEKASRASGARSWMISRRAVPSWPLPVRSGSISTLLGRSRLLWDEAKESTPSEMTPTLTPAPVRPEKARTMSVRWPASPSVLVRPVLVTP